MSKEAIETLTGELLNLSKDIKEKFEKGQTEYKELNDKILEVSKELKERKQEFEAGKAATGPITAEVQEKMDELFIAQALCHDVNTKQFQAAKYKEIIAKPEYKDAIDCIKSTDFAFYGQSTTDAQGGDFIPTGFSNQLLGDIYLDLEVAALFKRFNMPNATYIFPVSFERITARKAAEATAPTKDRVATDQLTFTAKKLMANVDFTDELEQDGDLVPILPFVRAKLIEGFAIAQEQIALNGDTTDTLNGGTGVVAADDARRVQKGIRALTPSGSTYRVSFASGGLTDVNLRLLRTAMGKYGKKPSDLAYIMDMADYNKCLAFTGYQALYQYAGAVTTTGELGRIDNIPIIVSELMPTNLNANGDYDVAGTKKVCTLVNKNGFMWGDRKGFALETFRNPYTQSLSLVGSMRLDLQKILPSTAAPVSCGVNY